MPQIPNPPGVYIGDLPPWQRTINPAETSITAFVGRAMRGAVNTPVSVKSFLEFESHFGGLWAKSLMSFAVRAFFENGGSQALIVRVGSDETEDMSESDIAGDPSHKTGLYALEEASLFNLLSIPPYNFTANGAPVDVSPHVQQAAAAYCVKRRAFYIMDSPASWTSAESAVAGFSSIAAGIGDNGSNAALYFPNLVEINPLTNRPENFPPGGAVAGIFARIDAQRGVWAAPAGEASTLAGVQELSVALTDAQNDQLNPLGLNCLRSFAALGPVIWGARTLAAAQQESEWKYVSVRRLTLFIEESLYAGTQWAVFEPNDHNLWAELRVSITSFMHSLFQQGAFPGATADQAYFVRCDSTTTTQADIDNGIVNIVVGFSPVQPAEFVIIQISQLAGQTRA